jgi:hypothetical protein
LTNLLFYLILLAGSIAVGLEALLIGFGGKLIVIYRERPWFTLGLASGLGLWVVAISAMLGLLLALETLYVCILLLLLTLIAGKTIGLLKPELTKRRLPAPERISDREIERHLRKRGFKKPIGKKRK